MANPSPPYIKLSNGDVIIFEKLGPQKRAVLLSSESVRLRQGNYLIGATERQLAETIILGYPSPTPTIVEEVLLPTPTTPPPTPPPTPSIPPTIAPPELEKQREQEAAKRDTVNKKLKLQRTLTAATIVATATQLAPLDRINQTINSKVADLQDKAISTLLSLASQLGIEGLDTASPTLPNICPPQSILDKALQIRNSLGTDIENTAKYVDTINASLTILTPIVNGTVTSLDALTLLKTATSVAAKLAPTLPGAVTALISDLDDIRTSITFKSDGTPKLPELQRALALGSEYTSDAAKILQTILIVLDVVDLVLVKCGKKPNALGANTSKLLETIKLTATSIINLTYKGFTFEIVEKPFSSTLKQKIGQAKNSQGIVLLQTEPSFTTDPQVLVNELKLIIDRDNLKAN